jgi:hypothetical protein
MTENHHIASDLLIGLFAREAACENETYLRMRDELNRLDNEIAILRAKLDKERSLVSLALYGRVQEEEKPFPHTTH